MRSPVILACLIGIQTCYHNAAGRNTEGYVQTSEMGWLEARKRCIEERNTDMFDPSETILLEQSDVVNNEFYWVGGFETSQWTWTDNSPLFTNIGLCGVPTDLDDEDVVDLPYNSVLECYRKCDKYRIGLNGSSCYCLDKIDQSACSKESRNITMCFGNPVDHCGTESRMSVYYVDIPFKMDADDGDNTCAYSKRPLFSSSDIGIHPYDCDKSLSSICVYEGKKKFDRCHNGLCVSTDTAPWTLSNQSCTLAKFSFSRRKDFIDLQSRWSYYWIGLHKTRLRHWIDGKTVQIDFENTDPVPRCLAMMKANDEWSEHWIPCNDEHQSICSSGGHSEPPIPCVSDTFHTTAETPSSTGEDNEIPRTTSQTREERQTVEENYAGKIGKMTFDKIVIYSDLQWYFSLKELLRLRSNLEL